MIDILRLVLDLLNIQSKEGFVKFGEYVVEHKDSHFMVFSRYSFLLNGFVDFVHGRITQEDFIALGDVTSTQFLSHFSSKFSADEALAGIRWGIKNNPHLWTKKVIVIDSCDLDLKAEIKQLETLGSVIFVI